MLAAARAKPGNRTGIRPLEAEAARHATGLQRGEIRRTEGMDTSTIPVAMLTRWGMRSMRRGEAEESTPLPCPPPVACPAILTASTRLACPCNSAIPAEPVAALIGDPDSASPLILPNSTLWNRAIWATLSESVSSCLQPVGRAAIPFIRGLCNQTRGLTLRESCQLPDFPVAGKPRIATHSR